MTANEPTDTAEEAHLAKHLGAKSVNLHLPDGRLAARMPGWRVRRFDRGWRTATAYATVGSWRALPWVNHVFEFLAMSSKPADLEIHGLLEMITARYAEDPASVQEGSILDLGKPWLGNSPCDHVLLSLPYPQGPEFEHLILDGLHVRYLWVLPITAREAEYGWIQGIPELEALFERHRIGTCQVK
jgi:Suppressor of fused protein (SUFU)